MINTKLKDIADVQIGLMLARKEATRSTSPVEYKRLTLRSIDDSGIINIGSLEKYFAIEELSGRFITEKNDIIVRTFTPLNPSIITDETINLIVPSQLISIRITSQNVLPKYLKYYLSQEKIWQKLSAETTGFLQRTIKTKLLAELEIPIPTLNKQKMIIELDELNQKKQALIKELALNEGILTQAIIDNIITGNMGGN